MITFADAILYFVIYSFMGWVLESVYASARKRSFVNRGFLRSCFCPIYGFGAVMIMQLALWIGFPGGGTGRLILFLAASTVAVSALEYATGWALEKQFHRRWWDYSDNAGHLHGHICLKYSLLWGGLSALLVYGLHPAIEHAVARLSPDSVRLALWVSMLYLLADLVVSFRKALAERGPLHFTKTELQSLDGFEEAVRELLEQDEVMAMDGFIQHGQTNRLHHSIRVSFLSYQWCKLLRFDCRSAARGGLLHDFFLNDWKEQRSDGRNHALAHAHEALDNAERLFRLNRVEREIVLKHRWPLTPGLPRHKETWVVMLVDRYCALQEYMSVLAVRVKKLLGNRSAQGNNGDALEEDGAPLSVLRQR